MAKYSFHVEMCLADLVLVDSMLHSELKRLSYGWERCFNDSGHLLEHKVADCVEIQEKADMLLKLKSHVDGKLYAAIESQFRYTIAMTPSSDDYFSGPPVKQTDSAN